MLREDRGANEDIVPGRHGKTPVAWEKVASGINAALPACTADGKVCRRPFGALHDAFRREEKESLRASGTSEEYTEREQLLTDRTELEKADKTEKEKRDAEAREAATAEVVRDALVGLRRTRSSSPEYEQQTTTPPSKRSKQSHTERSSDYLEGKAAERKARVEGRQQQHALEERCLDIEERRLNHERERNKQERDRNDKFMAMMSSKMHMMAKLIGNDSTRKIIE
ncbi:hypothetical protein PPTG_06351 [Phytophthora nicotianae INRA-310]|uniref:Uncharacterized protein n=1 Tax=Phytophthora nicotianae (strain INRA-310) TaxID=761204 RepID=W2QSP9_PHYN3|nr:hypothetical protein PPTG_06351 [Phytophthora nicotianae INRA-310]ETN16138.1 hypothetical protein PPTG_06351 [Phytophthora nicotianae INRA-310]